MRALRPTRCPVCADETLKPVKHHKGKRAEASGFICGKGHVFEPEPLAAAAARELRAKTRELRAEMQEALAKARAHTVRARELRKSKAK